LSIFHGGGKSVLDALLSNEAEYDNGCDALQETLAVCEDDGFGDLQPNMLQQFLPSEMMPPYGNIFVPNTEAENSSVITQKLRELRGPYRYSRLRKL
jgi:hypothetical protein